ncbi:transcription antitermination factor NusB [Mycoplasma seminis]|uniref:Transcription antitermination factor NusB n=1 Tax=Mycoplasma seminis TaxID=512749 RepID=A0ABY9HCE4_9MOLU|nr:transcription antitermination factor NusB [Mycoplasma seminis]WLP85936.1 transcription antitermination factor NusB [Mycoplasma seminis]
MQHTKSRRDMRKTIIAVLYKYELLEQPINVEEAYEDNEYRLNREELKRLSLIAKNYAFLKKTISALLNKNWKWERISPLIRAIILNGAFELYHTEPKIVLNEAIEITKIYFPKDQAGDEPTLQGKMYKFVNAILENYYKLIQTFELAEKLDEQE